LVRKDKKEGEGKVERKKEKISQGHRQYYVLKDLEGRGAKETLECRELLGDGSENSE